MHNVPLLLSGLEGKFITKELFNIYLKTEGMETATVHDEKRSPVNAEVLNRRQNMHSSEI